MLFLKSFHRAPLLILPSKSPLRTCCRRSWNPGFGPDQTLFVGDAKSDVLMARQAKVEPVAVLTGHLDRKEAQDLGVKYIIENVTCLPEVFKNYAGLIVKV